MRRTAITLLFLLWLGSAFADSINISAPTYIEGTWTPTITTDGTVGTPAYTVQVGSYTRNGREVIAHYNIQLSGWTGSPTGSVAVALTGLPTPTSTTNDNGYCISSNYVVTGLGALTYMITGRILASAPTTAVLFSGGNTQTGNITAAQFGTTGVVQGTCWYRV